MKHKLQQQLNNKIMTDKTKNSEFNVNDIVTIAKDFKNLANLDFAQPQIQVYYVMAINTDDTITLAGVWPNVPAKYIEGVPIESRLSRQIYYNTVHARPYLSGCVYLQEDIYSRPPFMTTMAERFGNTSLWIAMQAVKFHFVHELQHWFVEHDGYSRILVNQFWGMRKPLKI